jgi:hypothetical protein
MIVTLLKFVKISNLFHFKVALLSYHVSICILKCYSSVLITSLVLF